MALDLRRKEGRKEGERKEEEKKERREGRRKGKRERTRKGEGKRVKTGEDRSEACLWSELLEDLLPSSLTNPSSASLCLLGYLIPAV